MFRVITIEREYGCGAGAIAAQLARHLGWSLWDKRLTEEIARLANVDASTVKRCDERMDSRLYRLAKTFWRGSHESSSHLANQAFDTDCMMSWMEQIAARIAEDGNAVVVGRGAPFFFESTPRPFTFFSMRRAPKRSAASCRMDPPGRKRKSSLTRLTANASLS